MNRGCDPHFCKAHLFEMLLIAQQSTFLKCCLKNTADPITINLNYLWVQILYQFCTQDNQNIWHHHFTRSLLFFNFNFLWKSHTSSPFWVYFSYLPHPFKWGGWGFLSCSGHILELYHLRYPHSLSSKTTKILHFCSFLLTVYPSFRSFCPFSRISRPCPLRHKYVLLLVIC